MGDFLSPSITGGSGWVFYLMIPLVASPISPMGMIKPVCQMTTSATVIAVM